MSTDVKFEDGLLSQPKTNQTLTIKEVAQDAVDPTKLPKDMELGLIATSIFYGEVAELPQRLPRLRGRDRPGHRHGRDRRYSVVDDVGTVINPLLV